MPITAVPSIQTPVSQQLAYILSIYPILASILSYSNCSSITSLAHTCRTLHYILSTTIGPLRKPFPGCTGDLRLCTGCQTPVCKSCRQSTIEVQKPATVMAEHGYRHALVCRRIRGSRQFWNARVETQADLIRHKMKQKDFCQLCLPNNWQNRFYGSLSGAFNGQSQRELVIGAYSSTYERYMSDRYGMDPAKERLLLALHVYWESVPQAHTTCMCDGYNAGCPSLPHIVKIEDLPEESELVAFVLLPEALRNLLQDKIPVYIRLSHIRRGNAVQPA
ncbi:hypothetical protein L211DRAFT_852922 [Terfezia boudieri ATCC MYA-4762]|uniref:Uncharacterized protein n=1 Tax=Terfezia boudieri ATCC MYA-4762 TaxID=1051890 RepID=A0A3N4LE35_9PEZI|nr:hypothetical protein L211DRAFT_852922 [Terfezia boudieri ATCC MYA-4762]